MLTLCRASTQRIRPQDTHVDATSLEDICTKTGLTLRQLEGYGREARRRGYLRKRTERVYEYAQGLSCRVLRGFKEDWMRVDGTLPQQEDDMVQRYLFGSVWAKNSCAVDCALFCGIMLDAGRMQVDQITTEGMSQLPEPAQVLRKVVSREWGLLAQTKRDQMRDVLRYSLHQYDPARFPAAPALLVATDVLDTCLHSLPQLSYTDIHAVRCCDNELRVSTGATPSRVNNLTVLTPPLQARLQASFDGRPVPNSRFTCTRGEDCTRSYTTLSLVLDRMPPTLMIHLPSVSLQQSHEWGLFDDVSLTYQGPRAEARVRYRAIGCVVRLGVTGVPHFVVVWRIQDHYICYDGLKGGKVRRTKDWFDGGGRGQRIITLFCRIR